MRGTLHLVAAEDLPWMIGLLGPRVLAGAPARRAQLGITDDGISHARLLAVAALAGRFFRGHGPATVKDLARWAGLRVTEARGGLAAALPELARLEVDGVEY